MSKKNKKNRLSALILVFGIAISAYFLAKAYADNKLLSDFISNTVELDTIDLRYQPGPFLYFAKGCQGIRMGITNDQAFSVVEGLSKEMFDRPLTHDLSYNILKAYNVKLLYAKIDALKDGGLYTARLLFSDGRTLFEADSRPSDMAALTLRYGNKFAISSDLISNMTNVC